MKPVSVDYDLLWGYLVGRGLPLTREQFWDLPLQDIRSIVSMTEFSKSAIEKIWKRERTPFEVF